MFEDEEVSGLSEPARLLVRAVAALRAQDATALPGPQALAETAVLLREREKFAALTLSRLADVDTRELYALAGSPSASSWVAEQHTSTDRSVVALARKLSRLPAVEAAVLDGRLCLPAAITVGQAVHRCRRHVDRPDGHHGEDVVRQVVVDGVLDLLAEARGGYDQHDPQLAALTGQLEQIAQAGTSQLSRLQCAFVLLAEQLEPAQLPRALERLVDAVLPLQHADAVEDSHRRRALKLTRNSDGTGWTIAGGTLDLECGELLHTVLTAAGTTDPDNPADTAAWTAQRHQQDTAGQDTAGQDTGLAALSEPTVPAPRTRAQQTHDAPKLALRRLLDTGALGERGKTAPHLLITISTAALNGQPGALPATAASGAVLPTGLVSRLGCHSRLTRLVLTAGRRTIETSHTQRTLTAHERAALHARWGGRCAGAGCTSPPGNTLVPHHATPWAHTGTTSYADTVPLCDTTHHDLHEGHKTIKLRDGRYLGPDGWLGGPDG